MGIQIPADVFLYTTRLKYALIKHELLEADNLFQKPDDLTALKNKRHKHHHEREWLLYSEKGGQDREAVPERYAANCSSLIDFLVLESPSIYKTLIGQYGVSDLYRLANDFLKSHEAKLLYDASSYLDGQSLAPHITTDKMYNKLLWCKWFFQRICEIGYLKEMRTWFKEGMVGSGFYQGALQLAKPFLKNKLDILKTNIHTLDARLRDYAATHPGLPKELAQEEINEVMRITSADFDVVGALQKKALEKTAEVSLAIKENGHNEKHDRQEASGTATDEISCSAYLDTPADDDSTRWSTDNDADSQLPTDDEQDQTSSKSSSAIEAATPIPAPETLPDQIAATTPVSDSKNPVRAPKTLDSDTECSEDEFFSEDDASLSEEIRLQLEATSPSVASYTRADSPEHPGPFIEDADAAPEKALLAEPLSLTSEGEGYFTADDKEMSSPLLDASMPDLYTRLLVQAEQTALAAEMSAKTKKAEVAGLPAASDIEIAKKEFTAYLINHSYPVYQQLGQFRLELDKLEADEKLKEDLETLFLRLATEIITHPRQTDLAATAFPVVTKYFADLLKEMNVRRLDDRAAYIFKHLNDPKKSLEKKLNTKTPLSPCLRRVMYIALGTLIGAAVALVIAGAVALATGGIGSVGGVLLGAIMGKKVAFAIAGVTTVGYIGNKLAGYHNNKHTLYQASRKILESEDGPLSSFQRSINSRRPLP